MSTTNERQKHRLARLTQAAQTAGYQTIDQLAGAINRGEITMFKTTDFVEIDTNLEHLARFIHGEICDCDDKNCTIETEILDWIKDGDPFGMTVKELTDEAHELFIRENEELL